VVEVIVTEEFREWYEALEDPLADAVYRLVGLLEVRGVTLGHPYSSAIEGSRYPLRELRADTGGRYLRVFYAFDPQRQAVLLLGGDKTGDKRFYETYVPKAERLWGEYLQETGQWQP